MDLDTTMVSIPLRMLLQMQWQSAYSPNKCPICGESYTVGHQSDCKLALAIKDTSHEVKIQEED